MVGERALMAGTDQFKHDRTIDPAGEVVLSAGGDKLIMCVDNHEGRNAD